MKRKRCRYCKKLFIPNPRVGDHQVTCDDPHFKKAHKAKTNAHWRRRNPDYFRNDYPRVKRWLDQHPGYLKQYRQTHLEYMKKNREIQRVRDRKKRLCLDIQAEISIKPLEIPLLFSKLPCLDIQVPLDNACCLRDNTTIHTGG